MHIAIVTMVYNEAVNLPVWIRHYQQVAPNATLYVVDHASDDGSTEHLLHAHTIPLPRTEMDEWPRTRFLNNLQRALLQYFDLVIYTDCDELILPDPQMAPTLETYLADWTQEYASPVGLNVVHDIDGEGPIDMTRPLLSQRRYCFFQARMCKPVITRVPLTWEPGFHECDRPINIDKNLYLFHTKAIDRDAALQRLHISRNVRWSQKAIDANHGQHHRYDDQRFLQEFFFDRQKQLRKLGPGPFQFDAEIARLQQETVASARVYRVQPFAGPVVEIPERFRQSL